MLEILAILYIVKRNTKHAKLMNMNPAQAAIVSVMLVLTFEFIGIIVGFYLALAGIIPNLNILKYGIGLLFGLVGALISIKTYQYDPTKHQVQDI